MVTGGIGDTGQNVLESSFQTEAVAAQKLCPEFLPYRNHPEGLY
jgi:hypothetical protein